MSKQSLLLVDGDPRSLRVLEVSLKKAGFNVTTAVNGRDAVEKVELAPPDLVIAETQLEEIDGFAFCQMLKANPAWADIPFVFLTAQTDIATKIRGLELGVDDYLTKPIYIKEIVARARILLQKRQRTRIEERRDGRTRFAGQLSDMPIVDLIQTVEISRKAGLIQFIGEGGKQAAIYFRDGKVIDAEAGPLQGEDAVYRLLTWNEGEFEVAFRTVRRRDTITMSAQGLLMEGMRRLDEWGRLCEQLPPLETRFEIDAKELAQRLGEIEDEHNAILRLFDGRRSVLEVIDACDYGDLESLEVIARMYFEGVLVEAGPGKPTLSGEWMVPAGATLASPPGPSSATGLVSEDGADDADDAETDLRSLAPIADARTRDHSAEWTVDRDPDEMIEAPLFPMPSSATAASARPSLIQQAIDESDVITVPELEETPAPVRVVVTPTAAATPPGDEPTEVEEVIPRDTAPPIAVAVPPPTPAASASTSARLRKPVVIDRTGTATRVTDPLELPPNQRGSRWPALLIGAAVVAGSIYGVIRIGRPARSASGVAVDGGAPDQPMLAVDAAPTPAVDAAVAPAPPLDAAVRPWARDARPAPIVDPGSPAVDELARQLDDARALIASDPERALRMLDEILDERRSARALVVRAEALRRLHRIDDALGAVGAAISMSPRSATAWELKGRILWEAGRHAEATPAYRRFLQLQPTGDAADTVRWRLSQQ